MATTTSHAASEPALEVAGLSVTYHTGAHPVRAVRNLDLVVAPGEVLGIVGESGCGKSSLALGMLRLLGTDKATVSGTVRLGPHELVGADPAQLRAIRWQEVSLVPQSAMNALSPVLRIGDQIADVVRAHSRQSRRQAHETAVDTLRRVGLHPEHARRFPHELSGGMRQRAVIAMAIALQPRLIILDEPTTALDVVTQQLVLEQLMQLRDELGFALIFITHDLPLLVEWSDRIAVMYAGSIVETGPCHQLYAEPRHPYTRALLSSFPSLHGPREELVTIPGQPWDLRRLGQGCLFEPRCPNAMPMCRGHQPELIRDGTSAVACFLHHPLDGAAGDGSGTEPAAGRSADGDALAAVATSGGEQQ